MFVYIQCAEGPRAYRLHRGGFPLSGKVLVVQEASFRNGKLRTARGVPCQRVKVIATDDILGSKPIPTLTVQWLPSSTLTT